jgi:excisionase family DNA binding protein
MTTEKTDTPLPIDTPSAVSPAALARRWDCCRQTIYNMIHDGELHSFKVRNSRLIPLSEIDRIERGAAA